MLCCGVLQRKLKSLIGNFTFLEAYERTGRILNVSVCPADTNEPARLLNYLTAPQVLLRGSSCRLSSHIAATITVMQLQALRVGNGTADQDIRACTHLLGHV